MPLDLFPKPLSRRECLRTLGLGAAALTAAPLSFCGRQGPRLRNPNVVFILADDLGYGDVGFHGAADVPTPHLDALAATGVRFSQFYVVAPICTPSRVSFLTGRHYARGIESGLGLRTSETTLAEMLRSVGYRTGLFGKWHLGIPPDVSPNRQGFDEFLGFKVGAIDNYSHYFYWGGQHRHVLFKDETPHHEDGLFFPEIVTRECVRFIHDHRDKPFFLYVPFNLPHYPVQPPVAYVDRFAGVADPMRREYVAWVSLLDDCIGRILTALDDDGLRQDTIIAFASDHGHSVEERGGGGSSGPLRGSKDTLWEGGIRVPFVISWPGAIPAGQVRPQPSMAFDLLPTLASYCGATLPANGCDGRNLSAVISSADAAPVRRVSNFLHRETWAVREGPWKLLVQGTTPFLANLDEDPGETTDRTNGHLDVVQRLTDLHNRFIRDDLMGGKGPS